MIIYFSKKVQMLVKGMCMKEKERGKRERELEIYRYLGIKVGLYDVISTISFFFGHTHTHTYTHSRLSEMWKVI